MNKKKREKYNKSIKALSIKFNAKELIVINKMMNDEGWTNTSGFIKDKLFGESADAKYEKVMSAPDENDAKIIMVALLEELNRKLEYVNYRFDDEIDEFKKSTKELDEKSATRWFTYLLDWKKEISSYSSELMTACGKVLQAMDIRFERKTYTKQDVVPEHVIERASQNWNDTLSDEAMIASRIKGEKFQKDFNEQMEKVHQEKIKANAHG